MKKFTKHCFRQYRKILEVVKHYDRDNNYFNVLDNNIVIYNSYKFSLVINIIKQLNARSEYHIPLTLRLFLLNYFNNVLRGIVLLNLHTTS